MTCTWQSIRPGISVRPRAVDPPGRRGADRPVGDLGDAARLDAHEAVMLALGAGAVEHADVVEDDGGLMTTSLLLRS